jgi:hypothetical protein
MTLIFLLMSEFVPMGQVYYFAPDRLYAIIQIPGKHNTKDGLKVSTTTP